MLYEFGVNFKSMKDKEKIQKKILDIDEMFDLILIADNDAFDDSIILLKDALCWEYRDMVNFELNSKNPENKSSLSSTARQALHGNLFQNECI